VLSMRPEAALLGGQNAVLSELNRGEILLAPVAFPWNQAGRLIVLFEEKGKGDRP
jgi:hypothetical protein